MYLRSPFYLQTIGAVVIKILCLQKAIKLGDDDRQFFHQLDLSVIVMVSATLCPCTGINN